MDPPKRAPWKKMPAEEEAMGRECYISADLSLQAGVAEAFSQKKAAHLGSGLRRRSQRKLGHVKWGTLSWVSAKAYLYLVLLGFVVFWEGARSY